MIYHIILHKFSTMFNITISHNSLYYKGRLLLWEQNGNVYYRTDINPYVGLTKANICDPNLFNLIETNLRHVIKECDRDSKIYNTRDE